MIDIEECPHRVIDKRGNVGCLSPNKDHMGLCDENYSHNCYIVGSKK